MSKGYGAGGGGTCIMRTRVWRGSEAGVPVQ